MLKKQVNLNPTEKKRGGEEVGPKRERIRKEQTKTGTFNNRSLLGGRSRMKQKAR